MTAGSHQVTRHTASPEETIALGRSLAQALGGGMTLGLVGPLGAGKTQLVKGIAAGNADGATAPVTSPTFTLINEYAGRLTVYHLDAYRLPGAAALWDLGFDELSRPDSVVVVEWADRVERVMPDHTLWIEMIITGEVSRRVTLRGEGAGVLRCLTRLGDERR